MGASAKHQRVADHEMWIAEEKGAKSRKLSVELKHRRDTGEPPNPIHGSLVYHRSEAEYLKQGPYSMDDRWAAVSIRGPLVHRRVEPDHWGSELGIGKADHSLFIFGETPLGAPIHSEIGLGY
ncbi:hypothetical protein HAX54_043137 [Datura stramonium]|uniref:Uncharacterized protein n=1 Tax=Datura stramonium TaxID=4076 RepID=A0ABS8W4B9_DATST|nr:hypothetical protein [Datura stramonium]